MKPTTTLSGVFLYLVAIAHLLRLVLGVQLVAGDVTVPLWVSLFGLLIPAALATGC